jgi:hypothetical protein
MDGFIALIARQPKQAPRQRYFAAGLNRLKLRRHPAGFGIDNSRPKRSRFGR